MSGRRVRIPADTDRADPLIAGLSARQALIAAIGATACLGLFEAVRGFLPIPVIAALIAPVAAIGAVLVWAKADGVPADRLALAALGHLRTPTAYVAAHRRQNPPVATGANTGRSGAGRAVLARARSRGEVASFCLPVRSISPEGVIDVGEHGAAMVSRATTINFSLRSPEEQEAAVASFADLLNGLEGPASFHMSATPVDISAWLDRLEAALPTLGSPLGDCASSHRSFALSKAAV